MWAEECLKFCWSLLKQPHLSETEIFKYGFIYENLPMNLEKDFFYRRKIVD